MSRKKNEVEINDVKIPNCCKTATKKACGIEKSLSSRGSPSDVKNGIGVDIAYFYVKRNQVVCRK